MLGEDGGEVAAGHEADEGAGVGAGGGAGFDGFAVAEDGDAVGDAAELFEAVGDVDDARALGAEAADDFEEAAGFAFGEGGGGFVEDEDADVGSEGFGDLDELLLGHGEGAGFAIGMDVGSDGGQEFGGAGLAGAPVDAVEEAAGLVDEGDVFGDCEVGKDGGLLVDGRDAELAGAVGGVVFEGGAVEGDGTGVGLDGSGEDFDEGAFAGSVFADEGVDFAGLEVEGDVFEGADASVAFFDAGGFEEQLGIITGWGKSAGRRPTFTRKPNCRGSHYGIFT